MSAIQMTCAPSSQGKAGAVRSSSSRKSSKDVCMERSGTTPQHDLTSVMLWLANGPSEDAGAELHMERSGTVPQQDLTSVIWYGA